MRDPQSPTPDVDTQSPAAPRRWLDGRVRLGVVGARNIGRAHVAQARMLDGVEVVAVADTLPERLEEIRAEHGVRRLFGNAHELFAEPNVDAVILAVPTHLHAQLAIAALEAGKHVLVEKPIAHDAREASRMIEARDRADRVLMVGMNLRFAPGIQAVRAVVETGAIGEVQYARARWFRRNWPQLWSRGAWGVDRAMSGGGPLIDLGTHKLDQALHLMGFPAVLAADGASFTGVGSARAAALGQEYPLEDLAVGLLRLAGGRAVLLEASYFQNELEPEGQEISLYGTRGGARIDDAGARVFLTDGEEVVDLPLPEPLGAARTAVEHLVSVLRGEAVLSSTAEQGLEVLRAIEMIYASAARPAGSRPSAG